MSVQSLHDTINGAIQTDHSLAFTGDLVGSTDIAALLGLYFKSATIAISNAGVTISEDQLSVVVSGSSDYTGPGGDATLKGCTVGITLTPGTGGTLFMAAALTPADGWTLQQAFPGVVDPSVSGLSFTKGGLVICTGAYTEPVYGQTLARGMTLVASHDLSTSVSWLAPLITSGNTVLPVLGPVADPVLPVLTLTTASFTLGLAGQGMSGVRVVFALTNIADAGQTPVSIVSTALTATLPLGSGATGTVSATLPTQASVFTFTAAFSGVTMGDFALLSPFIGSHDPTASLPDEIQTAIGSAGNAFALSEIDVSFDLSAGKFASADIGVTIDLKGFGVFDTLPALKVDEIDLKFSVTNTGSGFATTFSAETVIGVTAQCNVLLGFKTNFGGNYLIWVSEQPGTTLSLKDLVDSFAPGTVFPELDISNLALMIAPRDKYYSFAMVVSDETPWSPVSGLDVTLDSITLQVLYNGQTTPSLSGSVVGVFTIELDVAAAPDALLLDDGDAGPVPLPQIDIALSAVRPAGVDGWQFSGKTGTDQQIAFGDLVNALAKKFGSGTDLPEALSTLTIENLELSFDTVEQAFSFGCEVSIEIESTPVDIAVTVDVVKQGGSYEAKFGGTVLIGELEFDLIFDAKSGDYTFVATYSHKPGDPQSMKLQDLVKALSPSLAADVPADVEIQLNSVKLVFVRQNSATQVAFGLDLGLSFGLQDLPLVGPALPSTAIAIRDLQFLYSSAAMTGDEAGKINALLPATVAPIPTAGLSQGVGVTATVAAGTSTWPIALGVPSAPSSGQQRMIEAAPGALAASQTSQGTTRWFDIQKSIGPVSLARFGVQYQDSTLYLLLDASFSMSGLELGLDGLGFGSPLTSFQPRGHLDGIGVAIDLGAVKINGGLLSVASPPPGVTDEYIGEVTISVDPYLISGVAAYAKVQGHPSFFAFAQIEGEFGGPPAFFVTGFMGGFGYNWSLTLPTPDQVYKFPFIAGLTDPSVFGANPTPVDVLNVLSGQGGKTPVVTPTLGENWIAAGLQFRSFELVIGRALVVVSFGKDFELALLGLATISLPQNTTSDAYAFIELQIEVVLKPDDGVFSAIGSLTPNSYLLTRDCHLTGGFAFCIWFGASPYAGDFVVTLGGYHPAFNPPAWYPKVANIGLNWIVSSSVTIKGGTYFAITPTAAMAGGSLQVLFQSGNLKAWLTAWINIMIRWKPFYLTADIGISVGVSYKLDLLFTSVTLKVELGAELTLWGPPTGGVAHVDWHIISFNIPFGADQVAPGGQLLDWTGFQGLLPNKSSPSSSDTMLAAEVASDAVLLKVAINGGLLRTDSVSGDWVVRGDELVLTTTSSVPVTSVVFGTVAVPLPANSPAKIDIRPMGAKGCTSEHGITLLDVDNDNQPLDLSSWPLPLVQTASLPEALWGEPLADKAQPAPAARLVPWLATGVRFAPPPASAGASIGPVDPDSLITPLGGGYMALQPDTQQDPISAPVEDKDTIQAIIDNVASAANVQTQQAIFAALHAVGAQPPTDAPLVQLGQQAGVIFTQPPLKATV